MLLLAFCVGVAQAATPLVELGFDGDDGGCVAGGETAQWMWGAVSGGPGAGYTGPNAWALNLGGGYLNDTTDTLTCPAVNLSGAARPVLQFAQWYALDSGDTAHLEVDDGSGWQALTPIYASEPSWTSTSDGWIHTAFDLSGLSNPLTARWVFAADAAGTADGWFVDDVVFWDGDPVAPRIDWVDVLADTEGIGEASVVTAMVRDDVALAAVSLRYAIGTEQPVIVPMTHVEGVYRGEIPGQAPDTWVVYAVVALDASNTTVSDPVAFRYYLAAPRNLRLDADRAVGHTVPLRWDAPDTTQVVSGYRIFRGDALVATSLSTAADVEVTGGTDTFTVRAVYGLDQGDASQPVSLTASIPQVTSITPASAWAGDHVRLNLSGAYLLLTEGEVSASLGEGTTVSVRVRDVDAAVLDVAIDASAPAGARDLTLLTPSGETVAPAVFEVIAGSERPQLLPAELRARQGQASHAEIAYVGAMARPDPTIDLGADVVVGAVRAEDGVLVVDFTVAGDAAVGSRAVTVDDGVRVYDGVTLQIDDAQLQATGCQTAPAASPALWVLSLLFVRRRSTLRSGSRSRAR